MVESWVQQEAEETEFPVDFDKLWQVIGYSKKDKAKKRLTFRFVEGEDYIVNVVTPQGGTYNPNPRQEIKLTVDCAKAFCMLAETQNGDTVRKYFIAAEKKLREVLQPINPKFIQMPYFQRLVDFKTHSEIPLGYFTIAEKATKIAELFSLGDLDLPADHYIDFSLGQCWNYFLKDEVRQKKLSA